MAFTWFSCKYANFATLTRLSESILVLLLFGISLLSAMVHCQLAHSSSETQQEKIAINYPD
jgi:hypothetical protein